MRQSFIVVPVPTETLLSVNELAWNPTLWVTYILIVHSWDSNKPLWQKLLVVPQYPLSFLPVVIKNLLWHVATQMEIIFPSLFCR